MLSLFRQGVLAQAPSVLDGETATPVDNYVTWLACAGLSDTYGSLANVLASSTAMALLTENSVAGLNAIKYMVRSTSTIIPAVANSAVAMQAVASSSAAMGQVVLSAQVLNIFVKAATAKTALVTNHVLFNTFSATMATTMTNGTTYFTKTTVNGDYAGNAITIGTSSSFVYVTSIIDNTSSSSWLAARHNHNGTEIIHEAFTNSSGTKSVYPQVFAIGGLYLLGGDAHYNLTYSTVRYNAV